ncbi:MAG: VanZ family protein [Ferruginibacter sp.]
MPIHFIKPAFLIFGIILPCWILYRLQAVAVQKKNGRIPNHQDEWVRALFIIYISTVAMLTIAPVSISVFGNNNGSRINTVPFVNTWSQFMSTLKETSKINRDFALENIIGNVLLFVPMGILLPVVFPKINSLKKVAAICLLSSLSIELIQLGLRRLGTYRSTDIDDVILNTIGGVIGWLFFKALIKKLYRKNNRPENILATGTGKFI